MEEGKEKEELREGDREQAPYSSEAERFNHAALAFEERSRELCLSSIAYASRASKTATPITRLVHDAQDARIHFRPSRAYSPSFAPSQCSYSFRSAIEDDAAGTL